MRAHQLMVGRRQQGRPLRHGLRHKGLVGDQLKYAALVDAILRKGPSCQHFPVVQQLV